MTDPSSGAAESAERPRYGCIAFVFAFAGFFGGGMIAAAIAKVVGRLQRCTPPEGFPACDLWSYVLVGALIGVVTLPTVTIWRASRSGPAPNRKKRS